jgi:hypothetical protein
MTKKDLTETLTKEVVTWLKAEGTSLVGISL